MDDFDEQRLHLRSGERLGQMLGGDRPKGSVDLSPASAYEAVTRRIVEDLVLEIRSLRARVDSLLTLLCGAIVLEILLRLAGWR